MNLRTQLREYMAALRRQMRRAICDHLWLNDYLAPALTDKGTERQIIITRCEHCGAVTAKRTQVEMGQ